MFNLFISYNPESWDSSPYEWDKSRAIIEYTEDEISERYKNFDEVAIEELKNFPTVFVTEGESTESRIGYITDIRLREKSIVVDFEFDKILPSLPIGVIKEIGVDIGLGTWELSRTHWAVKDEPIFNILIKHDHLNVEQVEASQSQRFPSPSIVPSSNNSKFNSAQVFIVHGHNNIAKLEVVNFVRELKLTPIVLDMQASLGKTIIEKIEHYSNVGFGIVIYTACDVGSEKGELVQNYRARQNVVFEHGYLMGKLERKRVVAIVKGEIETPNDISGIVYIPMDNEDHWKEKIKIEMRELNYNV